MIRLTARAAAALAVLVLFAGGTGPARADFVFTDIGSSSGPWPSINDNGTVVFYGPKGISTGNGGPVTTIAALGIPYGHLNLGGTPAINAAGAVAFQGQPQGGGDTLFIAAGGAVSQIANNLPGSPFSGFAAPAINNSNQVAFVAGFGPNLGVFRYQNGAFTLIADNTSAFDGFANNQVGINAAGAVAFFARYPRGVSNKEGLFVGSGGALITIADTSTFAGFTDVVPSINASGQVAFTATLTDGSQGIFVGNGGSLLKIADTSGPFGGLGTAAINDSGQVVFAGYLKSGGSGFFTSNGVTTEKVLAQGDSLFGSTVIGTVGLGGYAENNSGQVVFIAQLADGRQEVVVATPVPEPSAFTLALLGTLGLLGYGCRNRLPQSDQP
jgi:hypothetical protein